MAERLEKTEKARIAAQIKRLGPSGLAKATKELEAAKAEHDKPIPTEVLTAFPVPDVKSISWIPVQSVQERGNGRTPTKRVANSDLTKHIESDGSPLPFFVEYDHVKVGQRLVAKPLTSHAQFLNSPTLSVSMPYFLWPKFQIASAREYIDIVDD
jgi:hypothetical protein